MKKIVLFLSLIALLCSCTTGDIPYDSYTPNTDTITNTGEIIENLPYEVMTKEDIIIIFDNLAVCEQDSDCEGFYGECPLPCQLAVHKDNIDTAKSIMNNWYSIQTPKCAYGCVEIEKTECQNNMCVPIAKML